MSAQMQVKSKEKLLRVTLVKSGIGRNVRHRLTLRGLGLTRMNKTVELKNTPAIRGMVNKIIQLVKYEVVS